MVFNTILIELYSIGKALALGLLNKHFEPQGGSTSPVAKRATFKCDAHFELHESNTFNTTKKLSS